MRPSPTVPNVLARGAKVVFVLESPHVDEVAHGYPLAGSAGREMSEHIFDRRDVPFGLVAREQEGLISLLGLPCMKPFSVMNVSKQPLQKTAYTANRLKLPANIALRERLRRSVGRSAMLSSRHDDLSMCRLKDELYRDFRKECASFESETVLVPCGNFARAFCEKLCSDPQFALDVTCFEYRVRHPARRGWGSMSAETKKRIRSLVYCASSSIDID